MASSCRVFHVSAEKQVLRGKLDLIMKWRNLPYCLCLFYVSSLSFSPWLSLS
jgi:hypothetical protein